MPDFSHEIALASRGHTRVAGVDEAGRGPLAGPVCAAAVILPPSFSSPLLDDSKKLTKKRREVLYDEITGNAEIIWAVGLVEAPEIDEINILRATHRAMGLALDALSEKPDIALIDGLPVKGLSLPHEALVKGDGLSLSIAAASVIAKVTRDRIMANIDQEFPEYGFIRHQGYGTREHLESLRKHGPCRHHRRSFQPVSQLTLPL
ncbi:MAG: ribonuclease HII [Akkermansiaceae bacterium]|jgi:ribonuclease HII|nr:ribonuclease HII [Akkermansiaceae bacterium]MDP4647799.1 ribonuclease HII [Akkermansiaceae bacterium]MDP4719627.1 ribonuclease HII [Akkermansiaceae bacterium]MDP4780874.1 ribonuclease HII [Akkermansiaceae bacterium]MDP4848591.1 ribonuclease HII [Akkermansiaceae bacterium]